MSVPHADPHQRDTERFLRVLHHNLAAQERIKFRRGLYGAHTGKETR